MRYIKTFEEFARDIGAHHEESIKREIREMKINILEGKYMCTDAYSIPENPMMWELCPNCGLRPLIWEFNNGSSTACGCGESKYSHFSIHAESIMSFVSRNKGSALFYPSNGLIENWNQWVKTGKGVTHKDLREEGKW